MSATPLPNRLKLYRFRRLFWAKANAETITLTHGRDMSVRLPLCACFLVTVSMLLPLCSSIAAASTGSSRFNTGVAAGPHQSAGLATRDAIRQHGDAVNQNELSSGEGVGKGFCKQNSGYALGAGYDNVYACGPATGSGDDFDTVGFQCVELSERFLWAVYGDFIPNVPSGRALVSMGSTALGAPVGTPAVNSLPVPGDVVSMWGGSKAEVYGHTAVVTAVDVDPSGTGTIQIMEENGTSDGWDQINVDDWAETYGDRSYDGGIFYYNHVEWLELQPNQPPAASDLVYKIQGLGTNSTATAINGTGTVTGYVTHTQHGQSWLQPFLYNNGSWSYPASPSSGLHVVGINNHGVVAAWAAGSEGNSEGYALHAANSSKWRTLPLPSGTLSAGETTAIDSWGDVSGWLSTNGTGSPTLGAVWTHAAKGYALHELNANRGFNSPQILDSDHFGDAVGTEKLGASKTYATIWAPWGKAYRLPGLSNLNVDSVATSMRATVSGDSRTVIIVGSSTNDTGTQQAVEWTVTVGADTVHMTAPTLLAADGYVGPSSALAINTDGWVIGNLAASGTTGRAFLWRPSTGMVDLETLLPADSPWVIENVAGINSAGQIVAEGYNSAGSSGQVRGLVLTPYAGPATADGSSSSR